MCQFALKHQTWHFISFKMPLHYLPSLHLLFLCVWVGTAMGQLLNHKAKNQKTFWRKLYIQKFTTLYTFVG